MVSTPTNYGAGCTIEASSRLELSCLPLRPAASEAIGGFVPAQLTQSATAPIRLELRKGVAVVILSAAITGTTATVGCEC